MGVGGSKRNRVRDLSLAFFMSNKTRTTSWTFVCSSSPWSNQTRAFTFYSISISFILASITCTIATLVAITIDRARGLTTPFKWRTDSWKKAKLTVPCIWAWSFLLNTPLFIYPRLEEEGNIKVCGEGWTHETHGRVFWTVIFIISFSIPLVVITTTYGLIRYILRRGLRIMNPAYERRMTRMGVALVVVFFVCTGFQHIFYFLYTFSDWKFTDHAVGLLFGISNFLVSLQAALNPFLYSNIHQDLWKSVRHKVRRLLDLPSHIEMKRRESTIPRLSAYVVVKTNFIDDEGISNYDMCSSSEKGSSEVKVTLKVPTHTHGGCRLSDITLHSKHLSVSSFGSAIHYLMEMELPRKLSMSLNVSLLTTDDLESCKETAL